MSTGQHGVTGDDVFAQTLSRIARDVAPAIDVDTTHVVPTARRRRDRRRSVAAGTLGVVLLAGVASTQALAGTAGTDVVALQEPAGRGADERAIAPEIEPFGATILADDGADDGGIPTAVTVTVGAAGVAALGTGAWFAMRSRRHAR